MTGKHSKYMYMYTHTQFSRQSLDELDFNDISVRKVYFMPSCQSLFFFHSTPSHPGTQIHENENVNEN